MKQNILTFGNKRNLIGIITHSALKNQKKKHPIIVMLNAGMIHRVGPNCLHVKLAQKLALIGYSSLRFDFSGIGDSEISNNNVSFEISAVKETLEAIQYLNKIDNGCNYVLMGICTGAEIAFKTALLSNEIIGTCLINGNFFDLENLKTIYPIALRNTVLRYYKKNIFNYKRWIKLLTGKSKLFSKQNIIVGFKMLFSFFKKKIIRKDNQNISSNNNMFSIDQWEKLTNNNSKILQIYSEGSNSLDIYKLTVSNKLKNLKKRNFLDIEIIKDVDHVFTPIWSQEYLITLICNWVRKNF